MTAAVVDLHSRLESAAQTARAALLEEALGNEDGYWTGCLAGSALATATAVCALSLGMRSGALNDPEVPGMVESGLEWLAAHGNPDGGWGDTCRSSSNLSTTTLAWAAFGVVPGADQRFADTVDRAEQWLTRTVGSLDPAFLAPAIIRRYGRDRTFSVPILTMCAISGRLGPAREAWQWVLPLPFELAVFPHRWYAALRLPVVSYALPALIAIGQARHHHAPSSNPVIRGIRERCRGRTLAVLERIQPTNGGFLEATPLTCFVAMSLLTGGCVDHPVTRKGLDFVRRSMRPDGSWPIDTNLAVWVTTLSVKALSSDPLGGLSTERAQRIGRWLLDQQYQSPHPYTDAAPGGWGWTHLPGGVPDADDTAGAILALRRLPRDRHTRTAAAQGIEWLLNLQNRDGGIPTFCKGWGKLPFDRSSPDLTAHALRAWSAWLDELDTGLKARTQRAMRRAVRYLAATRRSNGVWVPLWFGNEHAPDEENLTYGTSRVLLALNDPRHDEDRRDHALSLTPSLSWLLQAQGPDGGWSGLRDGPPSIEETALALAALADYAAAGFRETPASELPALRQAMIRGAEWLIRKVEDGDWREPAPIGFYFARLWYFETLYPMIFTVSALNRLRSLGHDGLRLDSQDRHDAA